MADAVLRVTETSQLYTLSLHDALPISPERRVFSARRIPAVRGLRAGVRRDAARERSVVADPGHARRPRGARRPALRRWYARAAGCRRGHARGAPRRGPVSP